MHRVAAARAHAAASSTAAAVMISVETGPGAVDTDVLQSRVHFSISRGWASGRREYCCPLAGFEACLGRSATIRRRQQDAVSRHEAVPLMQAVVLAVRFVIVLSV
jgi:hypothetical protein